MLYRYAKSQDAFGSPLSFYQSVSVSFRSTLIQSLPIEQPPVAPPLLHDMYLKRKEAVVVADIRHEQLDLVRAMDVSKHLSLDNVL